MSKLDWRKGISRYTAAQIMAALGCPRGTAYDWLDGRRHPPVWQQAHWLDVLARRVPKLPKKD